MRYNVTGFKLFQLTFNLLYKILTFQEVPQVHILEEVHLRYLLYSPFSFLEFLKLNGRIKFYMRNQISVAQPAVPTASFKTQSTIHIGMRHKGVTQR